jgi:hypothetical protein
MLRFYAHRGRDANAKLVWTRSRVRQYASAHADGDTAVSHSSRLVLALIIVIVDWAVFFLPLSALFIAYVITTNPPWVRDFLKGLDAGSNEGR